jgi:hypothetical protein
VSLTPTCIGRGTRLGRATPELGEELEFTRIGRGTPELGEELELGEETPTRIGRGTPELGEELELGEETPTRIGRGTAGRCRRPATSKACSHFSVSVFVLLY